jgi:hypothetical protein
MTCLRPNLMSDTFPNSLALKSVPVFHSCILALSSFQVAPHCDLVALMIGSARFIGKNTQVATVS